MVPRGTAGDGGQRNRNDTPVARRGDGATLSSAALGMKRPTHAEQGQTWSEKRLRQTKVGR